MKYMLLMHVDQGAWNGLAGWSKDDVKTMVTFMRQLDKELRDAGELVELNGLSGPGAARTVRAQPDGDALVTEGLRTGAKDSLIGYWVIDVASPERMIEIATRISATPGPGGAPVNQQIEVHEVGTAPDV
jgi:hypothetical protein